MIRILITAPSSGSGKTAVTCGLLALMKRRGLATGAFKCGPDYIDPMFHRSVLGVESHNLDVFLAGEEGARSVFDTGSSGMDALICEGAMGYYDGIMDRASSDESADRAKASAWHLSVLLGLPAVLVVKPGGSALSLAAVIKGMKEFRDPSNICGVILNDCSSTYFKSYAHILEEESGLPVIGYLPHMKEAEFDSRHLGLMTASEIDDLKKRIDRIADTMEETVDMDRLLEIYSDDESVDTEGRPISVDGGQASLDKRSGSVRIAVARDDAFCFIYEESLEALKRAGADLVFFSPLNDEKLPENVSGIYLPGGYPELHARTLAENSTMRECIADAVRSGMPIVAECGGFLYMGNEIEDAGGKTWPMVGCLPGRSKNAGHLVRFGYGRIAVSEDSMLFRKGENIPVHEFHYWDTTDNGDDLELIKARDGSSLRFGFCSDSMYAGFPHLYMAGEMDLAGRFVAAAEKYDEIGMGSK